MQAPMFFLQALDMPPSIEILASADMRGPLHIVFPGPPKCSSRRFLSRETSLSGEKCRWS
jgi:hypothetical protein